MQNAPQRAAKRTTNTWPRGYKTSFMLNSAEHVICHAYISQITNNCKLFIAKLR